jgi:hypothetical protein
MRPSGHKTRFDRDLTGWAPPSTVEHLSSGDDQPRFNSVSRCCRNQATPRAVLRKGDDCHCAHHSRDMSPGIPGLSQGRPVRLLQPALKRRFQRRHSVAAVQPLRRPPKRTKALRFTNGAIDVAVCIGTTANSATKRTLSKNSLPSWLPPTSVRNSTSPTRPSPITPSILQIGLWT